MHFSWPCYRSNTRHSSFNRGPIGPKVSLLHRYGQLAGHTVSCHLSVNLASVLLVSTIPLTIALEYDFYKTNSAKLTVFPLCWKLRTTSRANCRIWIIGRTGLLIPQDCCAPGVCSSVKSQSAEYATSI